MSRQPTTDGHLGRRRIGGLVVAAVAVAGPVGLGAVGAAPASAVSADVVISQVYGGGGNSGATYRNDFIELANRGSAPVSLTGWSVQYASAAGTTWALTPLTGTIAAGAYYLVQEAAGAAGTTDLPTPDATGAIAMSATSGKVALVTATSALAGCAPSCPAAAGVRDFVGYGIANEFEGAAAAPTLTNTTAAVRGAGPDTDSNVADFTAAAPNPRSGATPPPPPPPVDCSVPDTAIGAVQGGTDVSPAAGTTRTVQGTVVGDYEGPAPTLRGFYLQDGGDGDPGTSDGIFVFNNLGGASPSSVALGQVVQVSGGVSEFQGQTQITATALAVCGDGGPVAPVDVTLPRAAPGDLEPYEGMLVRLPQTLTVTEHFQLGRFGQVVVAGGERLRQPTALYPAGDPRVAALQAANNLARIIIDDATNGQNPDPIVFGRGGAPLSAANTLRGGDTLTDPVGVLTYTWAGNAASGNAFRLRPVNALGGSATFVAANPRPDGAPAVGGNLRVASANLLNFFNTFNGAGNVPGCTFGVGGAPADCRGANTATEYDRQLTKELAALTSLDADVIGVMELENDGYGPDSAVVALIGALNAAAGAGTWAFVDPDAATGVANSAGTDAIKVALLYRTAAVTPVPGATFTDRASDGAGAAVFERNPVAQTFLTRHGARVTVVANHFKSKGSCPADPADPDSDTGDGQGCWNVRRTAQATELARWLGADVVPVAGSSDVVVLGDLNAYAAEDPVRALEAAGYVNLPKAFGGDGAYSYVFDGQWGYLDHVLASESLRPKATGAADVHINADEPAVLDYNTEFKSAGQVTSLYAPDRFRTSDHDPVVAGLQLAGATTTSVTSSAPEALYRGEVRWTATVASAGTVQPTGTVQFSLAGVPFGDPVPLVGGVATSAATSALPPGATSVEAVYSGSDENLTSTGRYTQQVRFVVTVTRPAPGSSATAGSTVQVRIALGDAAGAVPDDVAQVWLAACRVTVSVSGVQTLAPTCASGYEAADDLFRFGWKSAKSPTGMVTVTAAVTYPGIDEPQPVGVALRLR